LGLGLGLGIVLGLGLGLGSGSGLSPYPNPKQVLQRAWSDRLYPNPKQVLQRAWSEVERARLVGSSTACLVALHPHKVLGVGVGVG
jgi:hypothetical protein